MGTERLRWQRTAALSGALDDERLAGLNDAGARLAGGRAVVLRLVVRRRRQRTVLRWRQRPVPRHQVRRGGVGVPPQ